MSLINDALKRASQSDRNRPRPPEKYAPLEPAPSRRSPSIFPALAAGVVLALALAAWFFWQWWNATLSPAPQIVAHVAAAPFRPDPAPAPVAREAVPPPPAPEPAPPAKPVPAAWPADLKMMGIFFSKTHPRALINDRTVGVGDEIDGIRVTKIENDRVTVEWNGQVKELRME
jgi:hypothetical protein